MKPSFFNFSIQDFDHIKSLQQLRSQLLNLLLLIAFAVGSILFFIVLLPLKGKDLASVSLIYSLLYIWLALVTFLRRLPYPVRAGSWLIFFYLLGTINLVLSGFNVDAGLCFLTFVSMTTLLFDLRRGVFALGISSVTILLAGYVVVTGGVHLQLGLPQSDPLLWVIGGMIFLVTGIFLIFSLTVLVRGLLVNLTKVTTVAEKLEDANRTLQKTSDELENKVNERTAELVSAIGHLRESEETGRVILNATADSLTLVDASGTVLAANKVTAERSGKHLDEILGKIIYQFFPEELAVSRKAQMDKIFQTGEEVHFEDTHQGIWLEIHGYPVLDADGRVTRAVGTARDITERKQMEQSLAEAKSRLEERVAERTQKLLETQAQLRNLTKEVILAQEEERRLISRELHDEAGQALVSMKYGLESILAELSADNPSFQHRLASAIQQLDQTMERIRLLAHSLRPPLFDIADLDLTLKQYCREFAESTGLQIEYNGVSIPVLSEAAGLSFFRFLQEALTNIVKHAKATNVEVKLSRLDGRLSLSVADDGVGFPDTRSDGRGHIGMRERFMMLNGEVQIQSRVPSGLIVAASIPDGEK